MQRLQRNAAGWQRTTNRETLAELMASFLMTFGRAIHYWGCVPELRHACFAVNQRHPCIGVVLVPVSLLEGLLVSSWIVRNISLSQGSWVGCAPQFLQSWQPCAQQHRH